DGCPEPEIDNDGVLDAADRCPRDAEDLDNFSDADGCPDYDNDDDGIYDIEDQCPEIAEDKDGFQDKDGCPEADNDGDGVLDTVDKCPAEIEDKDDWMDDDGCPDYDDDRDGVPDGIDACLDKPETIVSATDSEDDGCPDGEPLVQTTADGSVVLTPAAKQALRFAKNEIALQPAAAMVVKAIARAAHRAGWDEVKPALLVTITDDRGSWSELAAKRSEQVVEYLRTLGVEAAVESSTANLATATTGPGAGANMRFAATAAAIEAGRSVRVKEPSP
ncbi:MAG: thrombospondin, partial [Pseudomonadota bacterium]